MTLAIIVKVASPDPTSPVKNSDTASVQVEGVGRVRKHGRAFRPVESQAMGALPRLKRSSHLEIKRTGDQVH